MVPEAGLDERLSTGGGGWCSRSAAMMLRYSLDRADQADRIEAAVRKVLVRGLRTADIWSEGTQRVGTREMGDAVVAALDGR